jgi:DNA ligase (NAD+)
MTTRFNEIFSDVLEQLQTIMLKEGEHFRAKAYAKAKETIMTCPEDIVNVSQLKGKPGFGETILSKLTEYMETGTLAILEREKNNPINIFAEIYGVGPKKAQQILAAGISTIDQLRSVQKSMLNETQQIGLQYYEDIKQRIPRSEIIEYERIFALFCNKDHFKIVGSYRRGAFDSGDIDVIVTSNMHEMVNSLKSRNIILHVLAEGPSKVLVIAKLPSSSYARRVDFLFSQMEEYAFAILYFTGSKWFNTAMRQFALNKGYTLNEYGLCEMVEKQKGPKVNKLFQSEKEIFDFLGLEFKEPKERRDGRDVIPIKVYIEQFQKHGNSMLHQWKEDLLTSMVKYADHHYFNGDAIMSDNEYDILKTYISRNYASNPINNKIGAKVIVQEAELPYPMPSLNKIKADTNALSNWIRKYPGNTTITCKLDGVSGLFVCQNGLAKLYTRGDGRFGQDISHMIPYIANLPSLSQNVAIRGEFIMTKQTFQQKYQKIYANARNMYTGIFRSSQIKTDIARDIEFVAYEVIFPEMKPSEQLHFLKNLENCKFVQSYISSDPLTNQQLSQILVNLRNNYIYEMDGLVVKHDLLYPRSIDLPVHAFAYKMVLTDQIAESIVVDVIWTPSKDGYLKPRVQIQPVHLCGVTIEFVTGNNAAFIQRNGIGIGATVQVIRSGDVIPKIQEVIIPTTPKMPSVPYHWNETQVDVLVSNFSDDPTVKEKNISGFFKGLEVEGLGSGNVSRLIQAGYDSVPKIIRMNVSDFLKVEGFKDKMANKLYSGIHSKLEECSLMELMSASNIFGRGFSDKKIECIMEQLPNILTSMDARTHKVLQIAGLKGFSAKTAEPFVEKIDAFILFLRECGLESKLQEKEIIQEEEEHLLNGKTIVLTGTRDKNILDFLKKIKCNVGSSVNKNTFLLVAKRKDDDTSKAEEARRLGIPIYSVEEFVDEFM